MEPVWKKIIEIDTTPPPPGFSWAFDPPHPPGNSNPFCGGGGMDIFWNHTFDFHTHRLLIVGRRVGGLFWVINIEEICHYVSLHVQCCNISIVFSYSPL